MTVVAMACDKRLSGGRVQFVQPARDGLSPKQVNQPREVSHDAVSHRTVAAGNIGLAAGGALPSDGDLDGDGDVDLADLAALLAVYGAPCA